MPSEKVPRLSPSYSWIRRSRTVTGSTNVFAAPRESQPGCMIPMRTAVCRPAASGFQVMIRFHAAMPRCFSELRTRVNAFPLTVFIRRLYSRFALSFISGSRFAVAATDSKMKDHSLHSVSRP